MLPEKKSIIPSQSEFDTLLKMMQMLVKSGFLPSAIKTAEQAMAIALKGRELDIPPMQAFSQISVIQGKPSIGAELMLALIYRKYPNAKIDIVENTNLRAEIKACRVGSKAVASFSFSMEDAKRAGLTGKDSWAKYPANMLYWRAVSNMARALFPDCLMGCSHTPEELGAEVNEDGEVLDVTPKVASQIPAAQPGEHLLPHEKEKELHEKDIAIADFTEVVKVFIDKGGDIKETLKRDTNEVIKMPVDRIRAATKLLNKELQSVGKQ